MRRLVVPSGVVGVLLALLYVLFLLPSDGTDAAGARPPKAAGPTPKPVSLAPPRPLKLEPPPAPAGGLPAPAAPLTGTSPPIEAPSPPEPERPTPPAPPRDEAVKGDVLPPCGCAGGLTDIVDFSKPAHAIEGQNKIRIGVTPTTDKERALTIDVTGSAYYPDGVVVLVRLRHWKLRDSFAMVKAVVKDHQLAAKFGPFTKTIPAGGLTVEAWFMATTQSDAVRAALVEGYYHSSPACRHDERNLTQITFSRGGSEAEAEAEADEKKQLAKLRFAVLDASKLDGADFERAMKGAFATFDEWLGARQFPFFPRAIADLRKLATAIRAAKTAGVPAAQVATSATVFPVAEALRSFIDEADSLDKEFERFEAPK